MEQNFTFRLLKAKSYKLKADRKAFAVLYLTVIIMAAIFAVAIAIAVFTMGEQTMAREVARSAGSYYASEAGIEDATYRVKESLAYPASYTIAVASSTATVTVTPNGSARIVESVGANQNDVRRLRANLVRSSTGVNFFYGVQVGDGGIVLGDNSSVIGNVFSNGDIAGNGVTKSRITGAAQAAGNHQIKDIRIDQNAAAARFDNCSVGGMASYVTSFTNCVASSTQVSAAAPSPQPFPITQSQIDGWKAEASAGGALSGYSLGNNASGTLGPKKINGNITLGNSAVLTLLGTVWVTGTINFGNTDQIRLDPGYGQTSGVLIVDGAVDIGNTATFAGSGQMESHLMLMSLFGPGDALDLGNNATGAIFYAPNGIIDVGNGLTLYEATGYGLRVGNNGSITYQAGLANAQFSSGPGGSFIVTSWKETE